MRSVKLPLVVLLMAPLSVFAQGRGPAGPPKNLKVLPADVNIQQTMANIRTALGVQCTFCHVAGDFASDDNQKKAIARNMMRMTTDINSDFQDGKPHVTCYTCHRGDSTPKMVPPAETEGAGGRGGRGGR
jgi:hypothetical protein